MAKLYSCRQLTAATEKQVQWLAEFARKNMNDHDGHRLAHDWAHGAVTLWDRLTDGHREPGDGERLRAMVDAIRFNPAKDGSQA
jgi:hypothetical protein